MSSIVFIDSRIVDIELLMPALAPGVRVVSLDAAQDGISQIEEALAGATGLDSIHIVSHGSSGALHLGSTVLTEANLDAYQAQLSRIGASLAEQGDILLYGCDVASGAGGASFIDRLARYTGADVAASADPTGSPALGGDWELEASTGTVEAGPLFTGQTAYDALLAAPALTPSGQLDLSFGSGGEVNADVGPGADYGRDIVIQANGRIVVAGYSDTVNDDFIVARYNADGSPDATFGGGDGEVVTAIGAGDDQAYGVAIDGAGRIVVAGYSAGANNDFAVARYNADGSPDTTFGGGDGEVVTAIGSGNDVGIAVAVQPDNKIVVAGVSVNGAFEDFALARYNVNGSPDTSFGGGDGEVTTAIGASHDRIWSVAIQADGRIVVAGDVMIGATTDFALARYNADGSLDTTFSGDGMLSTAIGASTDAARSVAIQADGKILVAGYSYNGTNYDFALARYNADGSLDTTFSGDGRVTTAIGSADDFGRSVAILSDGRILVAGEAYSDISASKDFAFVRYNSDGSLDTSFSGDGRHTIDLAEGLLEQAYGVAIQQDGMIVAGGIAGSELAMVRVIAGDIPDQNAQITAAFSFTFPANVFTDTDGDPLAFSASLAGGGALPSWLTFNPGTRTFSGTPAATNQGFIDVRVTASDGSQSASDVFTIRVGQFGTVATDSITGGSVNDVLDGLGGNDTLIGAGGNDTLVGGAGVDSMVGGAGNDTYFVDVAADKVVESSNSPSALLATVAAIEGITDTVIAAVNFSLANVAFVENLTLAAGAATVATGNTLNNILTGNAGANTLNGGSGNDTLNGGLGNDTMVGGAGNDTYVRNAAGDVITELAGQGTDTVQSSITCTLIANLENLTLTGAGHINGTGNGVNNVITGNTGNNILNGSGGNDTLNGGLGNDSMSGGVGNDTYVRNAAGDVVTELAGQGTDLVQSAVTYTLGVNLENLTLTGAGHINGTGNSVANVLTGNAGNNVLAGAGGADTLNGLGGNDTLVWDAADAKVDGGAGSDTLRINGAGQTLNLLTVANTKIVNMEIFNITGTGNNRVELSLQDVLDLSTTTNTLRVDGNAGDTVDRNAGWTQGANQVIGANTYRSYTQGAATLLVDTDITSVA